MPLEEEGTGAPSKKRLNVFVLADCSWSMEGEKIQSLNQVMRDVVGELKRTVQDRPFADLALHVLRFSDEARWHQEGALIQDFTWTDFTCDGVTSLGKAIDLMATKLTPEQMGRRNLPPLLILLSDGAPTDKWRDALQRFNATPWGKMEHTVRVAIAIGREARQDVLGEFTAVKDHVLSANNAAQLEAHIRWATITLSSAISSRATQMTATGLQQAPLPQAPVVTADGDDDDEPW
jgi:uncharacterized protein YegL